MTAMASRQVAVDKRRLEAVDQLWGTLIELNSARAIANMMAFINWELVATKAQTDEDIRKLFETLGGGFNAKDLKLDGANRARPYLPAIVWATYFAYLAVCMHAVMRWTIVRFGMDPKGIENNEKINELIKVALPQHSDYIDKFGTSARHHLLEALEGKLLQEVQVMMSGAEYDNASIDRAAEIVRRSNDVILQANPAAAAV